jgi:phage terminase large subunit-like protein
MSDSLAKRISKLPIEEQEAWLDSLDPDLRIELGRAPWWFIGRPEQLTPPGDWVVWLLMAGRRFGKTRSAAENLVEWILDEPTAPDGASTEWAVVADTKADCRTICVEGPSGILRALRNRGMEEGVHFTYNRSLWEIVFTTGQKLLMSGADDPDVGRGWTLTGLWADEICKWQYSFKTWSEGLFPALSVGRHPRAIVTTTPKRGNKLLKSWLKRDNGSVTITRGSIDDNRDNLSPAMLAEMHDLYDGTETGRLELLGEYLEETLGALWKYEDILIAEPPEMKRIVIAIDPAVTNTPDSDETGIILAGKDHDGKLWILGDYSCKDTTFGWAKRVDDLFAESGADLILYEKNQGGDNQKEILHSVNPYLPVGQVHAGAKQGKKVRAEPVANLYQQHKVFHVKHFDKLEDQYTGWNPDDPGASPDRLDAAVYALRELAGISAGSRFLLELASVCPACQQPNTKGASMCSSCHQPLAA